MAHQIIARQQGDDYQARWFWLQACALLDDFTKVERVVHEDDELKSFDDVAVYYRAGYTDETGLPLDAEFYQVKFHVTSGGALTAKSLCNPSFIGATTYSLLQRIKFAHEHCFCNRINYRLFLYTPWSIHPDDPLAIVHSLEDGIIRWDKLSKGGDGSKSGQVRKLWREHLCLESDEELRQVIANVRIQQGPTLEELGKNLNYRLEAKGLKPVKEHVLIHPYDELTRKMLNAEMNELTPKSILKICAQEGLLETTTSKFTNKATIGIRSFLRWAEDLENQTESLLCLSRHFIGRKINNNNSWNTIIYQSIASFLTQQITRGFSYRLHLDTHSSIAFLAGYLLPEKIGIDIEVVQHSGTGTSNWSYTNEYDTSSDLWTFNRELIHYGATETAVAIGLTHDIKNDVIHYIRNTLPPVGNMVLALPVSGPSSSSVRDGAYADALANQLIRHLESDGACLSEKDRLHIFTSAPNGFNFCLGRKMQSFPNWTVYEYDFGSGKAGAYSPSIKNPT